MERFAAIEAARSAHVAAGERLSARLWPLLRLVGTALIMALAVRVLLVQPFSISSRSMEPLLQPGDFVLVDKRAYGWSLASLPLAAPLMRPAGTESGRLWGAAPARGEVLAFVGPDGRDYVKRLVAVGGDRVALKGGTVWLNGRALAQAPAGGGVCRERIPSGASYLVACAAAGRHADFAEMEVPEGQLFLLGDNRGASTDSRVLPARGGIGLVPEGQLIGRAAGIFFSPRGGLQWTAIGPAG
jgi:signal peptidase I